MKEKSFQADPSDFLCYNYHAFLFAILKRDVMSRGYFVSGKLSRSDYAFNDTQGEVNISNLQ